MALLARFFFIIFSQKKKKKIHVIHTYINESQPTHTHIYIYIRMGKYIKVFRFEFGDLFVNKFSLKKVHVVFRFFFFKFL